MHPKIVANCMEGDGASDYDFEDDEVVGQEERSTSKAERLLGVLDTTTIPRPSPSPHRKGWHIGDTGRKLRDKASNIGSAIGELKGVFSSGPKQNDLHLKCPTPVSGHPDSDSTVSMPSPTFDAAASVSTLPSVYDSPVTPHPFGRHVSSSSKDSKFRNSNQSKTPTRPKKSATLEVPKTPADDGKHGHMPRASWHDLPFLDLPPISPSSALEAHHAVPAPSNPTPKTKSRGSSVSEPTVRNKLARRQASAATSSGKTEPSSDPSQPQQQTTSPVKASIRLRMPRLGRHVQDWLDRADLDRSPSITNRPLPRSADSHTLGLSNQPTDTPTTSSVSVQTLTSQPVEPPGRQHPALDAPHWPLPPDGASVLPSAPMTAPAKKMEVSNLYHESVLALSSSEDEDSEPETAARKPVRHRRHSSADTTTNECPIPAPAPLFHSSRNPSTDSILPKVQPADDPEPRTPSIPGVSAGGGLAAACAPTAGPAVPVPKRRRRLSSASPTTSMASSLRQPFSALDFTLNDETELGSMCVAAAERGFAPAVKATSVPELARPAAPKRASRRGIILSSGRNSAVSTDTASSGVDRPRSVTFESPLLPKPASSVPADIAEGIVEEEEEEANVDGSVQSGAQPDTPKAQARAFVAATGIDISHFPTPPRSRSRTPVRTAADVPPPPRTDSLPQPPASHPLPKREPSPPRNHPTAVSVPGPAVIDFAATASPGTAHVVLLPPSVSSRQGSASSVSTTDPQQPRGLGSVDSTSSSATGEAPDWAVTGGAPSLGELYGSEARAAAPTGPLPPVPPIPASTAGLKKVSRPGGELVRKKTISNVPIYVTGLSGGSGGGDGRAGEDGVATLVFSNAF